MVAEGIRVLKKGFLALAMATAFLGVPVISNEADAQQTVVRGNRFVTSYNRQQALAAFNVDIFVSGIGNSGKVEGLFSSYRTQRLCQQRRSRCRLVLRVVRDAPNGVTQTLVFSGGGTTTTVPVVFDDSGVPVVSPSNFRASVAKARAAAKKAVKQARKKSKKRIYA